MSQLRIPDLKRFAACPHFWRNLLRRKSCSLDTVAPGACTYHDDRVTQSAGSRLLHRGYLHNTDTHSVHQRVLSEALMGCQVASDCGDTQRISIPRHAFCGTSEDPPGPFVRDRSRPQDTQKRNGFRAHGKHVPDNSADTCCCALKRFHSRRMVMALYLEHYRQPVANIHGTCILTGALNDSVP